MAAAVSRGRFCLEPGARMCYCSEHDAGLVPAFAGTGSLFCQDLAAVFPIPS